MLTPRFSTCIVQLKLRSEEVPVDMSNYQRLVHLNEPAEITHLFKCSAEHWLVLRKIRP